MDYLSEVNLNYFYPVIGVPFLLNYNHWEINPFYAPFI